MSGLEKDQSYKYFSGLFEKWKIQANGSLAARAVQEKGALPTPPTAEEEADHNYWLSVRARLQSLANLTAKDANLIRGHKKGNGRHKT